MADSTPRWVAAEVARRNRVIAETALQDQMPWLTVPGKCTDVRCTWDANWTVHVHGIHDRDLCDRHVGYGMRLMLAASTDDQAFLRIYGK